MAGSRIIYWKGNVNATKAYLKMYPSQGTSKNFSPCQGNLPSNSLLLLQLENFAVMRDTDNMHVNMIYLQHSALPS